MKIIKGLIREAVILLFRPLIVREIRAWGKIYKTFVGNYQRNWFWQGARRRTIKNKLNGFWMDLDIACWSERFTFFVGRWYDLPTQKLIEQVLKKGDEVIDIGANVGMFSLASRYLVGSEGMIHSFEPNPDPRAKLNRNIAINKFNNVHVYPVGLGSTENQFTMYIPHVNSGEGSLAPFTHSEYTEGEWNEIQVDVKVGDELLQKTTPRLIKIDVEGAEVDVLHGLSKLIHNHRPLIIAEYVPRHMKRFGTSFTDILAIAQEHSYKIFRLDLVKVSGRYTFSLTPVGDAGLDDSCDILLGHIDDPYIRQI